MSASLHPRLRDALEHPENDDWFEVILELSPVHVEPGGSRADKIERLRTAFLARAEPVEQAVRAAGGEVLGEAWINSTLKCRIPSSALRDLKDRQDILKIDLPRPLTRNG